jgi:hypothetical protein
MYSARTACAPSRRFIRTASKTQIAQLMLSAVLSKRVCSAFFSIVLKSHALPPQPTRVFGAFDLARNSLGMSFQVADRRLS